MLEDVLARVMNSGQDVAALREQVMEATKQWAWVPNPGPQTAALLSEADELFYGGTAGGGKSDLAVGTAYTNHERSLILRRLNEDARDMAERLLSIIDSRDGYNGQLMRYQRDNKLINFGGCQTDDDKQRYKGRAHDLIVFDEISDFLFSQYKFIITWNRSATKGQRSRVICTGNPPTTAEGLWVIKYWAPWLDPTHPNPAEEGELRWFTTGSDGRDIEFTDAGPHFDEFGQMLYCKSRSFIRARLDDNPDLEQTDDYRRTLASLPLELRNAYRDGRFDMALKDNPWQVIPTQWIVAAQARWTPRPTDGVPMTAIGADVAQGGADNNVIACRHDGWFAPLIEIPGSETPLGTDLAGDIIKVRRDDAAVIIDCGGGYGGATVSTLMANSIEPFAYKGSEASAKRSADKARLKFSNRRAEIHWRLREALDPSQQYGSPIALPPDQELLSDLTAPTYEIGSQGVKVEDPKAIKKRLGRSPDKAYAVMLAWSEGQRAIAHRYAPAAGYGREMGIKTIDTNPRVLHGSRFQKRSRG